MSKSRHLRDERGEVLLREEERQECEIWTRCMGYLRPVSYFNPGKKSEYRDRKTFVVTDAQRLEV